MTHKAILLAILILTSTALIHSADPFYVNLLNEGKQKFQAGKYDEALESFKLAEFGLLDDKEFVAELYQYYALANYRKGKIDDARAALDKMKTVLGEGDYSRVKVPPAIERELFVMKRGLDYLSHPGATPGALASFAMFYETWDLLKANKLPEAEAKLKTLAKMGGDGNRLRFLEGYLAFQKGDHKRCISRLEKVIDALAGDLGEDAQYYLAYCHLKRGDLVAGEKYASKIKNPDYVHQLMDLMEEIKARPKK